MPGDRAAAYEFVLRRANILYACGKNVSKPEAGRSQLPRAAFAACTHAHARPHLKIFAPRPGLHVFMSFPEQEAYLDVTMPVLSSTLRALEAEHRQVSSWERARGNLGW